MATIKFDRQNELDEIIARIYLDTNKKFTKKALLEIIFELGIQDYHALLNKIKPLTIDPALGIVNQRKFVSPNDFFKYVKIKDYRSMVHEATSWFKQNVKD